jgi:UDP-2,3-diacylglucosamine pyrophosphatase LpxH
MSKEIVERNWINLYDSIEPLDRPLHSFSQSEKNYSMRNIEAQKKYRKKYFQSEKGKEVRKRYSKKYQQSEKYKEAKRKYQQSEKGKEANRRYYQSKKKRQRKLMIIYKDFEKE